MTWNQGLAGKALSIAEVTTRYLRVMAGPGTGKSFAMKRRVARLLEEGVDPGRILAVTFTRVAAGSLVSELRALGVAGCERIAAGTLHSFCFRLLNGSDVLNSGGRVARPLVTFSKGNILQFEAGPLLADIQFEGKRKDTKRILAFEGAWARLQSDEPGWPLDTSDRQFHAALLSWLTFHRAMLIGEVVPEALKYMRINPTAPERTAFHHVIVDEYQDLNRADQALLDLLMCESAVVIGDENQSIYGFRYAHPTGITEFSNAHMPTEDADLDECRRCPTGIVEIANHLIMQNHPRSGTPRLRPMPGNASGQIHIGGHFKQKHTTMIMVCVTL